MKEVLAMSMRERRLPFAKAEGSDARCPQAILDRTRIE